MNIYRRNSLVVRKVINGLIAVVKGTIAQQEDNEDGEYAFADLKGLLAWMNDYYTDEQECRDIDNGTTN